MKFIALIALVLSAVAFSKPAEIKNGKVEAHVNTFLFDFDVKGMDLIGESLEVKDGKIMGQMKAKLLGAITEDEGRDKHLHETFDTGKYPYATFVLDPTDLNAKEFTGKLTIKDVTKNIRGKFTHEGGKVKASFKVSIEEFKILEMENKSILRKAKETNLKDEFDVQVEFSI